MGGRLVDALLHFRTKHFETSPLMLLAKGEISIAVRGMGRASRLAR